MEKRLRELIKADRYLNPKEKDHYADYLERIEAPQYEVDSQRKMARQRLLKANGNCPLRISGTALPCGFPILSVTLTDTKKTCSMK